MCFHVSGFGFSSSTNCSCTKPQVGFNYELHKIRITFGQSLNNISMTPPRLGFQNSIPEARREDQARPLHDHQFEQHQLQTTIPSPSSLSHSTREPRFSKKPPKFLQIIRQVRCHLLMRHANWSRTRPELTELAVNGEHKQIQTTLPLHYFANLFLHTMSQLTIEKNNQYWKKILINLDHKNRSISKPLLPKPYHNLLVATTAHTWRNQIAQNTSFQKLQQITKCTWNCKHHKVH
jgi:hypothetical protein